MGSTFGEGFQGDSSGTSGAFRRGFPTFFYGKNLGRGGGKRVERGERMWEEGEEKLKSAYGKNEFCDHIVFFKNHVWGIS